MNAQPEEVRAWLSKGHADLIAAQILIQHSELALGPAAFHCQQAAEKALKAFLIWRSTSFDRVHNLVYLIDLCEMQQPGFGSLRAETERLAPYAVEIRYPGEALTITQEEAREALAAAQAIWDFTLSHLPQELRPDREMKR